MASRIARTCPFLTACPGATFTDMMVPWMGASIFSSEDCGDAAGAAGALTGAEAVSLAPASSTSTIYTFPFTVILYVFIITISLPYSLDGFYFDIALIFFFGQCRCCEHRNHSFFFIVILMYRCRCCWSSCHCLILSIEVLWQELERINDHLQEHKDEENHEHGEDG